MSYSGRRELEIEDRIPVVNAATRLPVPPGTGAIGSSLILGLPNVSL